MEGKKQLIAIWGSGGSGKTIASVKLGNALAKRKNNVILVSADENLPMVPLLMPNAKESDKEKTLGKIWAMGDFSQEDVLEQCVMFTGENRYSLLAYDMYDKRNNHTSEMAADLIFTLKQTVDFVIIDCCTNFLENPLSLAALQRSDYILKVMNPDPKSILETRRYAMDFKDIGDFYQHINILNNIYPWEDVKDFYDG
ncbi:MAG: AAA family ATPase, partial [Oscillospiraceae bacterium]